MANAERLGRPSGHLSLPVFLLLPSVCVSFLCAPSFAAVKASEVSGKVESRSADSVSWAKVQVDREVRPGEEVKTSGGSRVMLSYDDGSKVEVGPKSSFVVKQADASGAMLELNVGKVKAWVSRMMSRRFGVRTPTAVCSVRGTEFGVSVNSSGDTQVDLFKGSLGVADSKGNETLLKEGERVDVTQQGLGRTQSSAEVQAGNAENTRQALKREVGLEMTKEEVQAAAALEAKNAIYQQGKAMVDVNGHRVRIEDYVIRPTDNQFKLVVLNERADRFDYFYYLGTFNKTLPEDVSVALRQIPGCIGAACEYWLSKYETGRSNTTDSVLEKAWGGHLVDVNHNAPASDDVTDAFDPAVNDFVKLPAGTAFYTTLYDNYSLAYNGINHNAWAPKAGVSAYDPAAVGCVGGVGTSCLGIQSMANDRAVSNLTNLVQPPSCDDLDKCTGFREPGTFHQIIYEENPGGAVWDKWDNYIIDDEGKLAHFSDFADITSGAQYKETMLKWNYQQIITASEFQGRKIDMVFEPKVLIQSGLIQ